MRIVLVGHSLIYGGAETQMIVLARELAARGHKVAIYTLEDNNPRAGELEHSGVAIVADRKRWRFDLGVILRLREYLRRFQADIVQGFLLNGNLYARLAAAGTGIPALNSERNDNYRLPLGQRIGLFLTSHLAAGVVANSHAGARFAKSLFRLSGDRVHVAWNGLDPILIDARLASSAADVKREYFASRSVKVACLVGMIRPQKDYALALRVAETLTLMNPEWRVLFVGDCLPQTSHYKDEIMRLRRKLSLEGRAVFAGLRPDVVEIVSQCDVLFSTSLYEGFPNVVLEAMAAGTPVVSTAYSDIRLILPEPWQVVENRDPSMLAEAILRAESERISLARKQRDWVEANATISRAVDRLEDIYCRYTRPMPAR